MSIGPSQGIIASQAGVPGAQASAEARRSQEAASRERMAEQQRVADGVTAADGEDLRPEDREGDGRQAWQMGESAAHRGELPRNGPPDASGLRGGSLDLSG